MSTPATVDRPKTERKSFPRVVRGERSATPSVAASGTVEEVLDALDPDCGLAQTRSAGFAANLQQYDPGRVVWRLCCCVDHVCVSRIAPVHDLRVDRLQLSFSVSRDEEHVDILATCDTRRFDLGNRAHNYLLLTLARRRIADKADGFPDTSCGWLDLEDMEHDATLAPPRLNIDVFRIRKQFAALGVVDARDIIERRPRTRHLRIGTANLSISQS